ncbi:hypothetical protein A6M27_00930 [Acidithiobacillus thiooxidans]|uniref:Pyrrolo-quinoline quinone repeat domain-containing protein n=1 Tax=Acidithiobacillus thiooxidans TaxID=930 RepID=A0A1C2JN24_ACITH|nr:PQQ-binding-like beta-propeller repeat protein [Acidithiobacillus thiooxidans]OCX74433.1 hypothetical protein A6P07_05645 [Acidithiobacillus thiooxidans]OCX79249.1 hypothetical protein A6O24_02210 [Acidithiobacillus thiooxidans]OCX84226.1 hypothetical protein A6O26_04895 [Acidithiobacillus thiooxidans]OCX89637.1 hypothetical protein A6M27_00930 [Acidithiobacillus thiooxidans]OFC41529.1 hypothetical protein BAE47_17895 [Acidithiobacillus thiooxidans]
MNHKARLLFPLIMALTGLCSISAVASPDQTPDQWLTYAMSAGHNAVYQSAFPSISWTFSVPGANTINRKIVRKLTTIRDLVGFPIGVAVADGIVFAPNDNGYLYAINATNGRLLWSVNVYNQIMTTPIVATVDNHKVVFVGAGNSVFSYSHAKLFNVKGAKVTRGTDVSAIEAFHEKTGRLEWIYHTKGEDMPTSTYINGKLIFGNGDGHVYALNAKNGFLIWKTGIRSFVSMSSATPVDDGKIVVMGGTNPSRIYAINSSSGKLLWSVHPEGIFSSSGGDGTWAARGNTLIGQIEVRKPNQTKGTSDSEELALNGQTGQVLWSRNLGSGKTPPRNKDAVPTIVNRVIYTGSPVTHTEYAIQLQSGKILWHKTLSARMKAAPMVVQNKLIQPIGNGDIYTLNCQNGSIIHVYHNKLGSFGPQNGVMIGGTYFIGSNSGYMEAIPLEKILG